ncbi:MAG: FIG00636890: hypothetical protein, partial [uncultured Sphingomonas sp.]
AQEPWRANDGAGASDLPPNAPRPLLQCGTGQDRRRSRGPGGRRGGRPLPGLGRPQTARLPRADPSQAL